jgi:hypothetical protein
MVDQLVLMFPQSLEVPSRRVVLERLGFGPYIEAVVKEVMGPIKETQDPTEPLSQNGLSYVDMLRVCFEAANYKENGKKRAQQDNPRCVKVSLYSYFQGNLSVPICPLPYAPLSGLLPYPQVQ